jgi:hypothetical protein
LVGQAHSEKKKRNNNNNNNNNNNKKRCKNNKFPNFVERMSKSLTSLILETAKGISTKLGIYIKEGW